MTPTQREAAEAAKEALEYALQLRAFVAEACTSRSQEDGPSIQSCWSEVDTIEGTIRIALDALTAALAEQPDGASDELMWRCYVALPVLRAVLKAANLTGADIADELMRDIEKEYPEFPARSAMR